MAMLLYLLVYLAYCSFETDYKAECNELRFQDKTFELAYISLTNANTPSVVRQALSIKNHSVRVFYISLTNANTPNVVRQVVSRKKNTKFDLHFSNDGQYTERCSSSAFKKKTLSLIYISLTNANTRSVVRQALSVFLSIFLIIFSIQTRLVAFREIKFVHFRLCVSNYYDNI